MGTPRHHTAKTKQIREYRIQARFTRAEHDLIVARAADAHRTPSDYARLCLLADPPVVATPGFREPGRKVG
jgi:hypothetical protein